ncbi:hypothetical protein JW968_02185 [Candidatus Woesearchaeota archaeon]|nr:hypothetical protein [Candidatus Woesearchaeota archaeon]
MKKYILLISLALIIISGCAEHTEDNPLDAKTKEKCLYLASEKAKLEYAECLSTTFEDCPAAEMYRHNAIICIANLAKRNNNLTICSDEGIMTEICETYTRLMNKGNLTEPCVAYSEELCIFQYNAEN